MRKWLLKPRVGKGTPSSNLRWKPEKKKLEIFFKNQTKVFTKPPVCIYCKIEVAFQKSQEFCLFRFFVSITGFYTRTGNVLKIYSKKRFRFLFYDVQGYRAMERNCETFQKQNNNNYIKGGQNLKSLRWYFFEDIYNMTSSEYVKIILYYCMANHWSSIEPHGLGTSKETQRTENIHGLKKG